MVESEVNTLRVRATTRAVNDKHQVGERDGTPANRPVPGPVLMACKAG